jgi:hypothetical protein
MNSGAASEDRQQVDGITAAKIRRAMLSGPSCVTDEATVAEMDRDGQMTVLRAGTNDWICVPGDENIIGSTDMCLDPMGMAWMRNLMAGNVPGSRVPPPGF